MKRTAEHLAFNKRFGKRMRDLRLARGLSQRELAEACSRSQGNLWSIERGVNGLGLWYALEIAKALNVSIEDLTGD